MHLHEVPTEGVALYVVATNQPETAMPHAEIKYSTDLAIDPSAILAEIETVLKQHDDGVGSCKGRGYPTDHYHHSHITVSVSILVKPHRDEAYCQDLLAKLEKSIKALIPVPCAFSLGLDFLTPFYATNLHQPEAEPAQ